MHASHTDIGHTFDVDSMAVIIYLGYQIGVSVFESAEPIVLGISDKQMADSRQIAENFAFLPLQEPDVANWKSIAEEMRDLYPSDFRQSLICLFLLYLVLIMPTFVAQPVLHMIAGLSPYDETKEWARELYLPMMIKAAASIELSIYDLFLLSKRLTGAIIKLVWALLWQESIIHLPKWFLYSDTVIRLATAVTPAINALATFISGIPQTDLSVVAGQHIYPGSDYCNAHSPHALWHQQTAVGFFDLIMMADFVVGLIGTD